MNFLACKTCTSDRDAPIHRSSLYPGWHLFVPDWEAYQPPTCGTGEAMRASGLLEDASVIGDHGPVLPEDDPAFDHEDVELGGEG